MARKKQNNKTEKRPIFADLSPHAKQAIWAVVMGVIAIFFIFSLLDYAGPAGVLMGKVLVALFGFGAWLAPVICALYIYVLLNPREEDQEVSGAKVTGTVLLFVSLLGALELKGPDLGVTSAG